MSLQLLTVLTAGGGMALVGLAYNSFAAYFMFASLAALVLVAYVGSRLSARGLSWRREASGRVFDDEPFQVRLEVGNAGRIPRFLLTVADDLPEFVSPEDSPEFVVPALWPGEHVSMSYRARAAKRGVYNIGPLRVSASDPFGVFPRNARYEGNGEVVIYPRPVPVRGAIARSGAEPRGVSTGDRARWSMSGQEFYGIRDYRPGDELRRIHWPATARHAELKVIEFEYGASGDLAIVLDTLAGTEFGSGIDTTLEAAVRAAASLAHSVLVSEGTALLTADSAEGPRWVEIDRVDREFELLEVLARVQADGTAPVSQVLDWVGTRLPAGFRVCVITAMPDADLPAVVSGLAQRQMTVSVLVIDARSYDRRAGLPGAPPEAIEGAGALVAGYERGDDLSEALGRVLLAGY